jgi:hypothetical protein
MLDEILFVLYSPTDRNVDGTSKIVRRISCRLVRPFRDLILDASKPLGESMDASIISLCVEPFGDYDFRRDPFTKIFHICARCGSQMRDDECVTCAPSCRHEDAFSGGLVIPMKVQCFLAELGHVFAVDPNVARGYERNAWSHHEQALVAFSVHRDGIPKTTPAS